MPEQARCTTPDQADGRSARLRYGAEGGGAGGCASGPIPGRPLVPTPLTAITCSAGSSDHCVVMPVWAAGDHARSCAVPACMRLSCCSNSGARCRVRQLVVWLALDRFQIAGCGFNWVSLWRWQDRDVNASGLFVRVQPKTLSVYTGLDWPRDQFADTHFDKRLDATGAVWGICGFKTNKTPETLCTAIHRGMRNIRSCTRRETKTTTAGCVG